MTRAALAGAGPWTTRSLHQVNPMAPTGPAKKQTPAKRTPPKGAARQAMC